MSTSTETAPTALVPAWDESGRLVGVVPPGAATVTLVDGNEVGPGARVVEAGPYGMVGTVLALDPERRTLDVFGATGSRSSSPASGWRAAPDGTVDAPAAADRIPEGIEVGDRCACGARATRVHLYGRRGEPVTGANPWCEDHARTEQYHPVAAITCHPRA